LAVIASQANAGTVVPSFPDVLNPATQVGLAILNTASQSSTAFSITGISDDSGAFAVSANFLDPLNVTGSLSSTGPHSLSSSLLEKLVITPLGGGSTSYRLLFDGVGTTKYVVEVAGLNTSRGYPTVVGVDASVTAVPLPTAAAGGIGLLLFVGLLKAKRFLA